MARDLLRRGWRVVHRIAPALAERIDDRRRVRIRSAAAVSGVVRFEERIGALERDLELVSKQLAVVTMRLEQPSADRPGPAGNEERLITARLSAIAFYEERISRLEAAAGIATPSADEASSPR
ncbi:hypothetical protein ACFFGH_29810 [Lysobacter korlensis]|uniref:Uncharacterized protein n=1 Tax=Lysobacter korlensis TaxID=553636 RepID=A0ABV6RYK1_9GAMM